MHVLLPSNTMGAKKSLILFRQVNVLLSFLCWLIVCTTALFMYYVVQIQEGYDTPSALCSAIDACSSASYDLAIDNGGSDLSDDETSKTKDDNSEPKLPDTPQQEFTPQIAAVVAAVVAVVLSAVAIAVAVVIVRRNKKRSEMDEELAVSENTHLTTSSDPSSAC